MDIFIEFPILRPFAGVFFFSSKARVGKLYFKKSQYFNPRFKGSRTLAWEDGQEPGTGMLWSIVGLP